MKLKSKIVQAFFLLLFCCITFHSQAQALKTNSSLSALIDTALQNNYLLKAAENRIAINEADVEYFQKNFLPEAGLFGSASYWYWLMPNKQKLLGSGLSDVYTEFSIKYSIYDGGKNKTLKEIASNTVLINREAKRSIRQTIIYNVAFTWFELQKAEKIIHIHKNALNQLDQHLQNAQALYSVGKASNVDILKVKVQMATEKKEIDNAKSALEQKQILMNKLLGSENYHFQANQNDSVFSGSRWSDFNFSKANLLAETVQNYPELAQFDLKIKAKKKEESLYKTDAKPTVFTYGLANWEDNYIPFGNHFNYNIGVGVNYKIPYFKGSAYKIKMLESQLGADELKNSKNQLLIDLSAGIDDALNELENKKKEVSSNEEIIMLSRETLDNALVKYNAGQGNIIDVLDARSILTNAEINRYKSMIEYLQLIVRVNYYTGSDNKPFGM